MPSVSFDLGVLLRPVESGDRAFLFELFRAVRAARFEFQPGGHPQMEAAIRLQFEASENALTVGHPQAEHSIIVAAGAPAGRLMVDRTSGGWDLLDISLLPVRQRQGIGSFVVERLLREAQAAGVPVRCTVQQNNPAGYRFFRALGFHLAAQDSAYAHLEFPPRP